MIGTRVLVTGVTGFIGRNLARHLRHAGYNVVGTTTQHGVPGALTCDITDLEATAAVFKDAQPDIVCHCAAISSVTSGAPIDYYRTNVIGTENVLAATRELPHRVRFIFLSTAGVYGNHSVESLCETLAPSPIHHYGLSKFAGERLVSNYSTAIDATIVRPFNIIGPGQHDSFIVPKLVNAFARRQLEIRLGNIDVYRDYIDVETTCKTLVALIDCKASIGETVNLCTGRGTSLRSLIGHMQDLFGYDITIVRAPEFTRKDEVWRMFGSRAKLIDLLPDAPDPHPLPVVLQSMVELKTTIQERRA